MTTKDRVFVVFAALVFIVIVASSSINDYQRRVKIVEMQSRIDFLEELLRDTDHARCELIKELQRLKDSNE